MYIVYFYTSWSCVFSMENKFLKVIMIYVSYKMFTYNALDDKKKGYSNLKISEFVNVLVSCSKRADIPLWLHILWAACASPHFFFLIKYAYKENSDKFWKELCENSCIYMRKIHTFLFRIMLLSFL